jgi:nitrite reductase (NADH) small subunit
MARGTGGFVEYPVGRVDDIRAAGRQIVDVAGRRVGVLSVGDEFFAVRDKCPHRGAALCLGTVSGTFLQSDPQDYRYGRHERVIRCPWHGWEFDLDSGRSLLEPDRTRVRVYPTSVRDGTVYVSL